MARIVSVYFNIVHFVTVKYEIRSLYKNVIILCAHNMKHVVKVVPRTVLSESILLLEARRNSFLKYSLWETNFCSCRYMQVADGCSFQDITRSTVAYTCLHSYSLFSAPHLDATLSTIRSYLFHPAFRTSSPFPRRSYGRSGSFRFGTFLEFRRRKELAPARILALLLERFLGTFELSDETPARILIVLSITIARIASDDCSGD